MNPQDPSHDASSSEQHDSGQAQHAAPQAVDTSPSLSAPSDQEVGFYRPDEDGDDKPSLPEFTPSQASQVDLRMQHDGQGVSWTASEFIAHTKSPEWFLAFIIAALLVVIASFLITRSLLSTIAIAIAAAIFGVAANRPPRQMRYAVDARGVSIGSRTYTYHDFRSFSLVYEEAIPSIVLMPLKRFMPKLTIYFDPADENAIAELLASYLPMQPHQMDMTERLMRRIRF